MTSQANGAKLNFTTSRSTHSQPTAITTMPSPPDLFHNTHSLTARQGRLSTSSPPSVGKLPPSTPPFVGNIPPSTPPLQIQYTGISTPHSTGYAPTSESEYSPPMAADLLPGAPQTLDLMILTEYITSMFKQAGNNGSAPSEESKRSMQDFLQQGRYGREDIEAGFLHAVGIVCKAKKALEVAMEEVAASSDREGAEGLRAAFSSAVNLPWEEVDLATARKLQVPQLHGSIVHAYAAVAEIKVAIVDVYRRQMDAQRQVEADVDEQARSVNDNGGDKDEDKMEVDSVVET